MNLAVKMIRNWSVQPRLPEVQSFCCVMIEYSPHSVVYIVKIKFQRHVNQLFIDSMPMDAQTVDLCHYMHTGRARLKLP